MKQASRGGVVSVGLSAWMIAALIGCNAGRESILPLPTVERVKMVMPKQPTTWPKLRGEIERQPASSTEADWIPMGGGEDRSRWEGIIIHHSATLTGNAAEFDQLHKDRRDANGERWLGLGYDFVINNGRGGRDGKVEVGFRWREQMTGAHCRPKNCTDNYWNDHTIGICLVGNFEQQRPSQAQYDSLARLVSFLQTRYHIPMHGIKGHGQVPGATTSCPGRLFSWWEFQSWLKNRWLATR